jgi:hypothetical protein
MWLNLSESLYYFGQGGVTKVEPLPTWSDIRKGGSNTELFEGNKHIGAVKETVLEINELLNGQLNSDHTNS